MVLFKFIYQFVLCKNYLIKSQNVRDNFQGQIIIRLS